MSQRFGAYALEWAHFSLVMGLTADLLPVVSNPHATISPKSTLKSLGKTPSTYNASGFVVGIPDWTSYAATTDDVSRWSEESDYGICLQTRLVRAFDCDVTDLGTASRIRAIVGSNLPIRRRPNSPRMAIAFRSAGEDGDLTKRILTLRQGLGVLELLGTGQQFVVAGTHSAGGRYFWEGGLPLDFPVLSHAEVGRILDEIDRDCGDGSGAKGQRRSQRPQLASQDGRPADVARVDLDSAGSSGASAPPESAADRSTGVPAGALRNVDPVATWLESRGWTLGRGRSDELLITCPWVSAHTVDSGPTECVYWERGTGGFEWGHFKCLHAHCAGKTDDDFIDAIGFRFAALDRFDDLGDPADDDSGDNAGPGSDVRGPDRPGSAGVVPGQHGVVVDPQGVDESGIAVWRSQTPGRGLKRTTGGAYLATIDNLARALTTPGFWVRLAYDSFRTALMWSPWGEDPPAWRELTDGQLVAGRVELERAGFKPVARELFRDAVELAAQRTLLDSAREWMDRLPRWDGVPRCSQWLSSYCGADDTDYTRSIGRYLWTAAAGRVLQPGAQADMVPILVGAQGVGKTRGVEALAPFGGAYVNVDLAVRDADLSRRLRGRLIVELAELRGLHTRDRTAINDFITSRTDTWVPKYKEFALSVPRRFVAIGTTNDDEFLDDETGNRRWLPVKVGAGHPVDVERLGRDRAQMWAEGAVRFLIGGVDWEAAQRLAVAEHDQFRIDDSLETDLATWLARPRVGGEEGSEEGAHGGLNGVESGAAVLNGATRFTLRDALVGVGTDPRSATRVTQMRVGKALRALGYVKYVARIDGRLIKVWEHVTQAKGNTTQFDLDR